MVMARMPTGFAVIGDTQQLPGYCVLLYEDAMIDHLTDLPRPRQGGVPAGPRAAWRRRRDGLPS